ncbi:LOW QUALITY PROTEIN: hypothetical protein RJ639_038544 [Escallonia herrerae]|uniref:Endoglucanase n=1 Tax=Escallonia herrerae TaxID=1293975 RepID=A0AA89B4A0_9ASTE|nr:LOW QUALITY PROTEIN: hypothetical protein RJ639_038544 [Escallonia herrerae]
MPHSLGSPAHTSPSELADVQPVRFVHIISESGRLLPSSSQWNSIEIDYGLFPQPQNASGYESLPSRFSKSVDFHLIIAERTYFKRFVYITIATVLLLSFLVLLLHFLPHKHHHHGSSKNLTSAINQAIEFFDAQNWELSKEYFSEIYSRLQDGITRDTHADLVGGFYDSGNNLKFSFPTAYTITVLSWTVIEYHHQKYDDIGELDHVKDIIKWGSDYLLKLFLPPNSTFDPITLYSQVGTGNDIGVDNDISCWQRPEDMSYERLVSKCDSTASDLAGEIIAALSAASMVFKNYSGNLIDRAENLFDHVMKEGPNLQGTYTANIACGGQARQFYNSSGYKDELVWGGTWLFFATGNTTYLKYATEKFALAEEEELVFEKGIFYWNNKLTASAVLLTRLRFFRDLGYPFEDAFGSSTNSTDFLMCSYLSKLTFKKTEGGLILLRPDYGAPLQYAATASFLSKLYSDYLDLLRSGSSCGNDVFSLEMLRSFSMSQASTITWSLVRKIPKKKEALQCVSYILGENPMKMSYMVGFGDQYPTHVHHRGASIPWDGQQYSCNDGARWLNAKEPNPSDLLGAMVAGPDRNDLFLDERDKPWFTEPTISSNAGLVAALIALQDPPRDSSGSNAVNIGIDKDAIFENIQIVPAAP